DRPAPLVLGEDGHRRHGGRRPRLDAGPRHRGAARRRRLGLPHHHQRQHLRAGDDGRREGRGPHRREHPPRPRGPAGLQGRERDAAVPAGRPPQRRLGHPHRPAERRTGRARGRRQGGLAVSVNLTDIDPDFLADRPSRPRAKRSVLAISFVVIAAIAAWALITPDRAESTLGDVVGWISNWFGWFYIALATAVLVFVVYLGVRHSRVRLGGPDDRPEFSTFSWAAMLFAAGIGTAVMFFAVAEPASQYLAPPQGQAETVEAAR